MWTSVVPDAVTESGVEVERFGPVQATAFGDLPEIGGLNQIQGAAEPDAVAGGHLARAVEWMRSREVDFRVPVAEGRPDSEQAEAWLGRRGYERAGDSLKLIRDARAVELPEDPRITVYELGEDEADGEGMSAIIPEALGMPLTVGTLFFSLPQEDRWRCYTAALDLDQGVVAAGSMLICDGVAQLGPGATLEQGRGRGCNRALLRRRLLDAARAGCHTVFVELGECDRDGVAAVRGNLLQAGFEEAYG
ncbi:MAG: hypothetical protein H0X42_02310, partial [Solirubrobacterales bacterium]|nr:hypothetical protein [Solirubrobacterales bacterium]